MLISYNDDFIKNINKIKNSSFRDRVKKQIIKIIDDPEIGKPMRYNRKDTREIYISPYRLAYSYIKNEDKLIFLEIYHKDEQ